jgi:hypothetical protein
VPRLQWSKAAHLPCGDFTGAQAAIDGLAELEARKCCGVDKEAGAIHEANVARRRDPSGALGEDVAGPGAFDGIDGHAARRRSTFVAKDHDRLVAHEATRMRLIKAYERAYRGARLRSI